jgi:hypothetical protein
MLHNLAGCMSCTDCCAAKWQSWNSEMMCAGTLQRVICPAAAAEQLAGVALAARAPPTHATPHQAALGVVAAAWVVTHLLAAAVLGCRAQAAAVLRVGRAGQVALPPPHPQELGMVAVPLV